MFGSSFFLRFLQTMVTERAFFNDTFGPDRYIRIQVIHHFHRPSRFKPIEVFGSVGTRVGAVPASDTSCIDLRDEPLIIFVRRIYRTDLRTRRVVALHARARNDTSFDIGIFAFNNGQELHPRNVPIRPGAFGICRRNIVLGFARNDTCIAAGAPVEIDHHSPSRHIATPYKRPRALKTTRGCR